MRPRSAASATAFVLAVLPSLRAQVPMPGHRLLVPLGTTDTYLVDDTGATVHTWTNTFHAGLGCYLLPDGSLLRAIDSAATATTLPGTGGGVQRLAWDSTVLWDYRFASPGLVNHHDIVPMPNGNVLLLVWEDKTVAQAIGAGRDPALITGTVFRPDAIYEVQPTGPTSGQVVWQWHMFDHLVQDFDANQANYGTVGAHPELLDVNFPPTAQFANDYNHCNGIDYDPIHDWIAFSAPRQNEVYIIDHGTTTAQAAGHTGGRWGKGGDLLYRWGNPQAYRAGTWVDEQLFFQHDPRFVPPGYPGAGNLTVFNNQLSATNSAVVELVLPVDAAGNFVLWSSGRYGPLFPIWNFTESGFASGIISSAQRLPNGNTLICSGVQGRVFEVTSGGREVFSWQTPTTGQFVFQAHWVDRTLWAGTDQVSAAGGSVPFSLLTGARNSGAIYLLLAGFSGTSPGFSFQGLPVPLNADPLVFGSAQLADTPVFQNTLGMLGTAGDAAPQLNVTPGLIPAAFVGMRLDFAALLADPHTLQPYRATTPIGVRIVP